jgi:hypothetical protein
LEKKHAVSSTAIYALINISRKFIFIGEKQKNEDENYKAQCYILYGSPA